jgi:DNA-binding XRE family transcriptional regulator
MPQSAYLAMPLLRGLREYIALSQAELAAAVGVSPSTIVRLEHGGRTSPEHAARLTTFLEEESARWQAWCEAEGGT